MLLIRRTGIIFRIRNWLHCLTAFEIIHHHFIIRWYFSLDVLCVKEREHWYSGISSEFIIHNTRVIGLQIASKETWTRSLYCIFGVIGDVKCTWSDSKEKVHHVQRQSLKISKDRWIFFLTAFDCSRLGYSLGAGNYHQPQLPSANMADSVVGTERYSLFMQILSTHFGFWGLYTTEYHVCTYWTPPFDLRIATFAARRWEKKTAGWW